VNLVFTLTLPRTIRKINGFPNQKGANDEEGSLLPFQHVYGSVEASTWGEVMKMLHEQDFIIAQEFNPKERHANTDYLQDRGTIIINTQMIGKIKPFTY
jgi:hypothetical protein